MLGVCVRAEAATDRAALLDVELLRILDAFLATVRLVYSFLVLVIGKSPFKDMVILLMLS